MDSRYTDNNRIIACGRRDSFSAGSAKQTPLLRTTGHQMSIPDPADLVARRRRRALLEFYAAHWLPEPSERVKPF